MSMPLGPSAPVVGVLAPAAAGGIAAPVVVAQQLAQTGASTTSVLLTFAAVLIIMGFLLVGLYRRHVGAQASNP